TVAGSHWDCTGQGKAAGTHCTLVTTTSTYSIWSSDHVFCLPWTGDLWQLLLYLAGSLWLFFLVLNLLSSFEWRGLAGYTPAELLKAVGKSLGLLVVAFGSFGLLLLVHQVNFLLINSLVGDLSPWRVDSLWGKLVHLVTDSQN